MTQDSRSLLRRVRNSLPVHRKGPDRPAGLLTESVMQFVVVMRTRQIVSLDRPAVCAYAIIAMSFSGNESHIEQTNKDFLTGREEEVVRRYIRGLSAREAGAGVGLSTDQVYRVLRKAGVRRRRRGSRPLSEHLRQRNRAIVRLHDEEGLTLREIGSRFGLSHERVRKILETAGRRRRGGLAHLRPEERTAISQEVVRLYVEDGMTLQEVGARFGLSRHTVDRIFGRAAASRRRGSCRLPREAQTQRNQEIIRLYVQGRRSCKELAVRFGLSESSVGRVLETAGVGRRPGGLPRLTREERAQRKREIVRLYFGEGLTRREVATRLGVSNTLVNQTIHKCGAHPRFLPR